MATTSSDLLWQYGQEWELWWRWSRKNTPFAANKIWRIRFSLFSLYKSIFSKLSLHQIFKIPCWLFPSLWYMNSLCSGTFKIGECWCRVLRLINSGFRIYVGSLRQYFITLVITGKPEGALCDIYNINMNIDSLNQSAKHFFIWYTYLSVFVFGHCR